MIMLTGIPSAPTVADGSFNGIDINFKVGHITVTLSPYKKYDIEALEKVQKRATKIVHMAYEDM